MKRLLLPLLCALALLVAPQAAVSAPPIQAQAKLLPKLTYDPKLATKPGPEIAQEIRVLNDQIDAFNRQVVGAVDPDRVLDFVSRLIGILLNDARFYPPLQNKALEIATLYCGEARGRDLSYWSNIASPWWLAFPGTLNDTQLPGYTVLWLRAYNPTDRKVDLRSLIEPMCLETLDGRRIKALDAKELIKRGIDGKSLHYGVDSPFDYWPPTEVASNWDYQFGLVFPGVVRRSEISRITGQYGLSSPEGSSSVVTFFIPFWENL